LRQVEEAGGAQVAATQSQGAWLTPQQVQVRNGSQASFRLSQAIPLQWVQSVTAHNLHQRGGASGLEHGVTWVQAGQRLSVRAHWPGGKQAVTLELTVQSASVPAGATAGGLASQTHSELATTVSAALGQWMTVAVSGAHAAPGVYGSEASSANRRLLQIRVSAP
jgi:hypothetical protein